MQVRISKPTKSSTQSVNNKDNRWLLEFVEKTNARYKESFGRTSSSDMQGEVKLYFDNLELAEKYARDNGYKYEVIKPKQSVIKPKSYAANFG